uniref:Uncharacterized protein n=1 Tax=Eutreptiella gymnastica TaxID=73025 RepID=A0A7S4FNL4_9EUGL|mmetsp:Transcript_72310/g.121090  ORF Transcript_72310/g.121090 Transcript_72310/m.121090 type:complete len:177 (+) Transcript_72310:363-893(+)
MCPLCVDMRARRPGQIQISRKQRGSATHLLLLSNRHAFGVFQILPPDTPKKGVPTAPTTNDTKGGVQQTLGVNGCLGSAAPPLPHRARNASGAAPETRPAGPAGLPENLRTSPLRPGLHWGCIALHRPRTSAATGAYKATGAGRSYGLVFAQFVRAECTTTDGRALHVTPPGVPQP